MTDHDYWVALRYQTIGLGTGFFLTSRYLLTAEHCLRAVPAGESKVEVVLADGSTLPATVCQRLPEPDLALLVLIGDEHTVDPPRPDVCATDDRWRSPSRPTPSDPELGGSVMAAQIAYQCERGGTMTGLQLRTDVALGDYSGYSGGPVEKIAGDDRALAGVLIEQYPDRQAPERASNVLFAATVAEVFDRFESFSLPTILARRPTDGSTRFHEALANYTALLREAKGWERDDLIPPDMLATLRLRVARSVVDEAATRRQHRRRIPRD